MEQARILVLEENPSAVKRPIKQVKLPAVQFDALSGELQRMNFFLVIDQLGSSLLLLLSRLLALAGLMLTLLLVVGFFLDLVLALHFFEPVQRVKLLSIH